MAKVFHCVTTATGLVGDEQTRTFTRVVRFIGVFSFLVNNAEILVCSELILEKPL